ncbi:type I restriction endonuclease subunit R [Helicobacter pylori]|uniref:HsdR family type I site-specific deoxyribonuclease n=1 Tax=Helicobacter pylori TaxID=210 RepID=UPI0009948B37|nr:type I restriction endonuclease subunit R [Helicobacter pylori]OOQ06771.1 DEAD/DEAH box helicase [Helicobacter pylori]PDW86055.1 DEAD/DEAH box helicase [Helicobacter pylori]WQU54372.1 type I restriction endonuclease subunit R [Helicobacter pylori]
MSYETIAESNESTVVAQFHSDSERKSAYESEAELERAFIKLLEKQGYEFKKIHNEKELKDNLKEQLEKLNNHYFTPKEWDTLYSQFIANKNDDYKAKTRKIQEDPIFNLTLENGKTKNVKIIDKKNIHRNALQVIHQYSNKGGKYQNRYDVSVLVNGLPLVHVELKKRGVAIREAFNQIKRYKRDSFSAEDGLFEFVQIFVISNGTSSKYYSNTTRIAQLEKNHKADTFEFTNYWADSKNHNIEDLMDFAKRSLLNVLTRYCVFTSEEVLLVMRPYQIVAAERILEKIKAAHDSKTYKKSQSAGYIWHTTGSGKTLTSFKSAMLAKELEHVSKVLFVVDRKDLDYQTMKEYDKFQKDCANSNTSTKILKQQLEDSNAKIIITTIQKLDKFVKSHSKGHAIFNEEVVMIFDECHRSQLGSMHQAITKAFKKYHLFGFTGTPIFAQNCDKNNPLGTTEQKFGTCLHQYTIIDAIRDKNVLPFRVEYHNTIKAKEGIKDKEVRAVDEKNALLDNRRIKEITKCIVERFNQATKNKKFNSILACQNIEALKKYYQAFKEEKHNLKIAAIFSYSTNEELEALEDENNESTAGLDKSSRDFLEGAIADYNGMFGVSFDTSDQKFQSYYKDLSQKMKNREIDLLLVVNMFLTGFDATRLNTLWVDKNVKYHGLIQAFSRTNRILDSVKTHGNIVCFRDLEQDLNDALMLFGNKDAQTIALLRKYEDYLKGYTDNHKEYEGYEGLIGRLLTEFPLKEPIISESQKKDFIKLFGKILKLENILNSFENFNKDDYINPRDFQDYQSKYLDFYDEMRPEKGRDKEEINDDLIFEIELIKQVEVNIDYILTLIEEFAKEDDLEIQGVKTQIEPILNSSIELRNKRDLIMGFIDKYNKDEEVHAYFQNYIHQKREEEFQNIIEENRLNEEKAYSFMQHAFSGGEINFSGTEFPEIIEEKVSRFDKNSRYQEMKEKVAASLSRFFHRFCDLTSAIFKKNEIKKDEVSEK